jgi:hypothetical protein
MVNPPPSMLVVVVGTLIGAVTVQLPVNVKVAPAWVPVQGPSVAAVATPAPEMKTTGTEIADVSIARMATLTRKGDILPPIRLNARPGLGRSQDEKMYHDRRGMTQKVAAPVWCCFSGQSTTPTWRSVRSLAEAETEAH